MIRCFLLFLKFVNIYIYHTFKMVNNKLPKNWIAVASKSHPDRMYYFNIKTNETTWIQPVLDTSSIDHKDHDKRNHNKTKARTSKRLTSKMSHRPSLEKVTEKVTTKPAQMHAIPRKLHESTRNSSRKLIQNEIDKIKSVDKSSDVIKFTSQKIIQQNSDKRLWDTSKDNSKYMKQMTQSIQGTDKYERNKSCLEITNQKKERFREEKKKKSSILKKNLALKRMEMQNNYCSDDNDNYGDDNVIIASTCRDVEVRLKKFSQNNIILKEPIQANNDRLKMYQKEDKDSNKQNKKPTTVITVNMTKSKLEQANQEIFYEEMDWEPMRAEEIILEVEVVRTQLNKKNCIDEVGYISEKTKELIQPGGLKSQDKGPLYIVVDTNVFLSNLEMIEQIKNATNGRSHFFIVIPWTVIRELDFLKDKPREELRIKARKAIAFIHEQLISKHPRVVGQTYEEAVNNRKKFSLECPDDEILQCCLQIRDLQQSVVLLSHDINLCNKALIHKIKTLEYGKHLEINDLEEINDSDTIKELRLPDYIFEETKAVMKIFLSTIIKKHMAETYGAEWKTIVKIKPPWTVVTALKCAIKHWIATISELFCIRKRCEYILKELLPAFQNPPIGNRKLQDVEHILEQCNDLLQMVKVEKHSKLVSETSDAIMKLKQKCQKKFIADEQKELYQKIGCVENIEEQKLRMTKAFLCFENIYTYARDVCGLACTVAGMAHTFDFQSINPPLSHAELKYIQPQISKKLTDLTMNLNKLLKQTESTSVEYETLFKLQQSMNTFLLSNTFDIELLDIYYCVQLKEDTLKYGLRQLQELSTYFNALACHM